MSYEVYKLTKTIESTLKNDNRDYYENQMLFNNFVSCFNIIADTKKYNPKAPYFNLKLNWALLKKECFTAVLVNIENWLKEAKPTGYDWVTTSIIFFGGKQLCITES